MSVATDVDNKYGLLLADRFSQERVSAVIIDARMDPDHIVRVRVGVADVGDWTLRYAILAAKRSVERDWDVEIVCTIESIPAADLPA